MAARRFRLWPGREVLLVSARTTVATLASLLLARLLFRIPEFYWAPISTIVVLLSTIDPMKLAWQRFVGTAIGATVGAILATFFTATWVVYAVGIFVCGILSGLLRLHAAYRFAAIALTIVLLVAHTAPPWIIAVHRFFEVSLGIAVALLMRIVWKLPATAAEL